MGRVTANLKLTGKVKSYPVSKTCASAYIDCEEVFSQEVKVGSGDSLVQIYSNVAGGSRAIGATPGFKAMLLKNTGKVPIEISEKYPLWTNASADVDNADYPGNWRNHNFNTASENATNADEIDSAYVSRILCPGEFAFIHTQRALIFDGPESAGYNSSFVLDNMENNASTYLTGDREGAGSAIGHAQLNGSHNDSVTTLTIQDDTDDAVTTISNLFHVGDILIVGSELMHVTAVGSTLTVERGYLGSTAGSHSDNVDVKLWALNDLVDSTSYINDGTGISSRVAMTDVNGDFKASNLFGAGRLFFDTGSNSNDDVYYKGIQPGSLAIKLYKPAYHEFRFAKKISSSTDSKLTAGSTYYFKITIDDASQVEINFTVDSSVTSFGGKNGVIRKIQDALNTASNTKGNNIYRVYCSVGIVNGRLRFTSQTRNSSDRSGVALANGTSGSDSGTSWNLLANNSATGIFPQSATELDVQEPARLPEDTVFNSLKNETIKNEEAFLYDDGKGNIFAGSLTQGRGSINYDSGAD